MVGSLPARAALVDIFVTRVSTLDTADSGLYLPLSREEEENYFPGVPLTLWFAGKQIFYTFLVISCWKIVLRIIYSIISRQCWFPSTQITYMVTPWLTVAVVVI